MNTNNSKGFSLAELMIVIAIIAIITSIAIPAYNGYITTARMSEAKNNIAALKLAEEEHFLEYNSYFFDTSGDNANLASASKGLWSPQPGDDGVNFTYTVSAGGSSYQIIATGQAGKKVAGLVDSFLK